ncbi:putative signal peptide-containing protein [Cryptosporidium canis]|uniref:Signal peptide-containing protein n=1 Tax=Cryptosporidium canis TaxID=195482 RepID=A0ABQ8PBM9_9CRYT|nr:putative signal peptide-containing protein [Cryptosporidium canis]
MVSHFIVRSFCCCLFGLVVVLAPDRVLGEGFQGISEGSRDDFTNEISYDNGDFMMLDFSQTGSLEDGQSVELFPEEASPLGTSFYNPFLFESEQRERLVCQEKFCTRALYGKKSSRKFKSYVRSVLRHYILESRVRSWFFRLWSGSTVLTSPVLYIGKKQEFKEIYKLARKNYQKLKDSAVIVILKVLTKKVSKELALEEEEEASKSKSDSAEGSEGSSYGEESRTVGYEDSGERSYSISQAVKGLCVKLRGLSKHRSTDNGQSYLFVIEAHGITDKFIFSRLMTNLIQTSCWNRANMNKSRVIIPVIVGSFTHTKESDGILGDIYSSGSGSGSGSGYKRSRARSRADQDSKQEHSDPSYRPGPEGARVRGEEEFMEDDLDQGDVPSGSTLEYNALFVKWLKVCNESKMIYERYQTANPELFERILTQYLIYAVSNRVIVSELSGKNGSSRHFISEYPQNCQKSWDELLLLIEREFSEADLGLRIILISTILESLKAANNTIFKDADQQVDGDSHSGGQASGSSGEAGKDVSGDLSPGHCKSRLEKGPEVSELYSILSTQDQSPTTLPQARMMDDLLIRLEDLPDQRKSRLEFKRYLSGLKSEGESASQIIQLLEAVDHIQSSLHLVRVMYITSMELGLVVNPLEILVSVCRNAKIVPADGQGGGDRLRGGRGRSRSRRRESRRTDADVEAGTNELEESLASTMDEEEFDAEGGVGDGDMEEEGGSDVMDECNPFSYLSEGLLTEDYDGDVMESIQKSSIRLASLLLRQAQYNTKILSLHVSNLVIKTERLLLSNILEAQRISSMVLVLAEKVRVFPFTILSSFSYLREVSEARAVSMLRPFAPLYPSYSLMGLYGDSIQIKDWRQLGRVLMMEICMLYYDPKSQLDPEFLQLCVSSWESSSKDDEYFRSISRASSRCKRLTKESEKGSKLGGSSPTVFLLCDLLDKLVNGPGSKSDRALTQVKERYLPKEFENMCENVKSYSIQQSGNLYNMLVKL